MRGLLSKRKDLKKDVKRESAFFYLFLKTVSFLEEITANKTESKLNPIAQKPVQTTLLGVWVVQIDTNWTLKKGTAASWGNGYLKSSPPNNRLCGGRERPIPTRAGKGETSR